MAKRRPSPTAEPDAAPGAGIAAGTPVLTLDGALPVQFLSPGDRVITRSGARVLQGVEVTTVRDAALVRVDVDARIAAGQPVHLRDWRARALCGHAAASVPAGRLADGETLCRERRDEARLFTLRFEREEVIYAGGLELTCAP